MSSITPCELPAPFKDARGVIRNLVELDGSHPGIRGAAVIHCAARTTRSNHYHRTDAHWLYVLSGEMHYWERRLDEAAYPQHPLIVKPGGMVYTGPELWHRTYFPCESVVVSLSLMPRDNVSHEADLVREATR